MGASAGKYLSIPGANNLRLTGFNPGPGPGTVNWSTSHGGTGDDVAYAVVADGASNLYVAGTVTADGDVGCGAHSTTANSAFVARYDSTGTCQWATYMDGTDDAFASAIAYDSVSGNVYVTGGFNQSITINGATKTSAGGYDAFLAKISFDGVATTTIPWAISLGGALDDYPFSVAAGNGQVAVGGALYELSISGGAFVGTSRGDADAFIATYADSTGAYSSSWTAGGTSWDAVNSLAARPGTAGFTAIGMFSGSVDFGNGAIASTGGEDGFLVNLNSSLVPSASRSLGGTGDDSAHGLVVDSSDNIFVTGYFQSSMTLDASHTLTGSGAYTGYLAKFDNTTTAQRSLALDSTGMMIPESLTAGLSGSVVLAGHFTGTATVGSSQYTPAGTADGIVVSFDSAGAIGWSGTLGGTSTTEGLGVAVSTNGKVVVVGDFTGSVNLSAGTTPSAGGSDFFLLGVQD